jgi:hypothetical protein
VITRILVGGAVALGAATALAAPADGDPAFNQLSCSCQVLGPEHGVTLEERINRGIQEAHAR